MMFFNNLQVIRAYAAMSVALHHLLKLYGWEDPGQYGVDIFFVISGFIMANLAEVRPEHFVTRRIIRIVPLYWTATLALFAVFLLVPGFLTQEDISFVELFKSLFFIPYERTDGLVQPILFLGWTLNYEMYFYIVFALAMALNRKMSHVIVTIIVCLPIVIDSWLELDTLVSNFYGHYIVLNFVSGILIYRLTRNGFSLPTTALWVIIAATLVYFPVAEIYIGKVHSVFYYGIPSFLLILAIVLLERSYSMSAALLVVLGNASYSLYLIHPYLQGAAFKVFGLHTSVGSTAGLVYFGLIVIGLVAASILSYEYVEKPMINRLRRWAKV